MMAARSLAGLGLCLGFLIGAASPLEAQLTGALGLRGGYAEDLERAGAGGGFAGSIDLSFVTGILRVGPEVGYAAVSSDENVVSVGGVVRLGVHDRNAPFLVAGLGGYFWDGRRLGTLHANYLSGSIGAGVPLASLGRSRVVIEGRFHTVVQRTGTRLSRNMLTLAVGADLMW